MTTREQLEALNGDCARICAQHDHRSPTGKPNLFLLYSTPETFEPPATVMWLGKHPGGRAEAADRHSHDAPFRERLGWSAYLDYKWGDFERGQHPMQRAVRDAAICLTGDRSSGEALLRASPAGNLSPFRSESWSKLPPALRNVGFGVCLIRLARPRILVLLFSEARLWSGLMGALGRRNTPTTAISISAGAGFTLRESAVPHGAPEFIFALPGFSTKVVGHNDRVLAVLRERIAAHGLAGVK